MSDDTLAVDDIAAVGAFGDFLSLDATCATCASSASRRCSTAACARTGRRGARPTLRPAPGAKALELVETSHEPRPLDADVRDADPTGSSRLPTVRKAWHERPAQAGPHRRQRRHRERPHPGAARRPAPRAARSSTTRCCPAWRWSASACASGECFIPEVLLSARTMQGALELIRPHLAAGESTPPAPW